MATHDVFQAVLGAVPDVNRRYLAMSILHTAKEFQVLGDKNFLAFRLTSLDKFVPCEADGEYKMKFQFGKVANEATVAAVTQAVIKQLTENPVYPKHRPSSKSRRQALKHLLLPNGSPSDLQSPTSKRMNLDTSSTDSRMSISYQKEAIELLANEFRWLTWDAIGLALKINSNKYLETRKFFTNLISPFFDSDFNVSAIDPLYPQYPLRLNDAFVSKPGHRCLTFGEHRFCLLERARKVSPQPLAVTHPKLLSELETLRNSTRPGETNYLPVECLCCFTEPSLETLLSCTEGHIYCQECVLGYVKTKIEVGVKQAFLECMENNCTAQFSRAVLIARIPNDLVEQLDERIAALSVNQAGLQDLVRCPKCSAIYELETNIRVLNCPNCSFISCRRCGVEWKDHKGKTCEDIESSDETTRRRVLEEKMTAELIRFCSKCKTPLLKNEGCNKLTCACGATLCYVCRTPSINYDHFCRHPRDPGKPCAECTKCSLWIDPAADDDARIKAFEEEVKRLQEDEKQARLAKLNGPSSSKAVFDFVEASAFQGTSSSKGPGAFTFVSKLTGIGSTATAVNLLEVPNAPAAQPKASVILPKAQILGTNPIMAAPKGIEANEPAPPAVNLQAPRPPGTQPKVQTVLFGADPYVGLVQAVDRGNLTEIRELVARNGVGLLQTNRRGDALPTIVHRAAANGPVETLRFLLDLGAPISPKDRQNNAPIHVAIKKRNINTATLLLDRGENVDVVGENGETPLLMAANVSLFGMASLLLVRGANVKAAAQRSWKALHFAARNGNHLLIKLLLDKGADINAGNRDGNTPLMTAIVFRQSSTAELLIKRGADLSIRNIRGETALQLAASQPAHLMGRVVEVLNTNGGNIYGPPVPNHQPPIPFHPVVAFQPIAPCYQQAIPYGIPFWPNIPFQQFAPIQPAWNQWFVYHG